jgi:hypothetical protein
MFVLFAVSMDCRKLEQSLLAHRLGIFSTAKTKKSDIIITTGLDLFWSKGDEGHFGFPFRPCRI